MDVSYEGGPRSGLPKHRQYCDTKDRYVGYRDKR
jgi:hypothetical protein